MRSLDAIAAASSVLGQTDRETDSKRDWQTDRQKGQTDRQAYNHLPNNSKLLLWYHQLH